VAAIVEGAAARLAPGAPDGVCLGFHAVADQPSMLAMPPARFAGLMGWLAERGVRGVSVAEWRAGAAAPCVVLTFDDGFASVHEHALPVLDRLGFHATVFPIAGALGRRTAWRAAGGPLPEARLMDRAELAELLAAGWEVGGHTLDHVSLPELPATEARRQIEGCKGRLEDALQAPVRAFAYPYGRCSAAVAAVVGERFDTGWTTRPGRLEGGERALLPRQMLPPRATSGMVRAAAGALLPALQRRVGGYDALPPGTDCATFVDEVPAR
jgi:peptidoglycan/xylan/chitin deacetylase (PgdA/CDA1 family)